ncbi:MAG: Crp/Fnr family transcriptional regulator [Epsilonproteobacteria bacterium]|nr:Crp/Fnr family transcriptional regulator [Campylobacterota bacterium]
MELITQYLKQLHLFASLNDEDIEALAKICVVTKHPKDAILYYENDVQNKLFFLVSGLLKVYKIDKYENEIFLYHIYPNTLISELTTLDNETIHCFANAEFAEDSVLLEINYLQFKERFLHHPEITHKLINEILQKNHQLHCVVNRELVFNATSKVAYMLMDDLEMFNKLKRQEVSFMLHIQPETLSRVLKKLTRNEIIEINNATVKILNKEMLRAIYMGDES